MKMSVSMRRNNRTSENRRRSTFSSPPCAQEYDTSLSDLVKEMFGDLKDEKRSAAHEEAVDRLYKQMETV